MFRYRIRSVGQSHETLDLLRTLRYVHAHEADITVQLESDLPYLIMMLAIVYRKIIHIGNDAG